MRQILNFSKHEGRDAPPPSVIHQTFSPEQDTLEKLVFDIKMAGAMAHMSTTMYIEREFEVQTELPHTAEEEFTINDQQRMWRPYNTTTAKFTVNPGFVLQENMDKAFFRFNGGSVTLDPEWIASYRNLYKKELEPYLRGSGRRFANHNDDILHHKSLFQEREPQVDDYLIGRRYIHPDRADRRVLLDRSGPDVTRTSYWLNEPLVDGTQFLLTDPLTLHFGWTTNPQTTVEDENGEDVVVTLSAGARFNAAEVRTFYDHYREDDDARLLEVRTIVNGIFDPTTGEILHNHNSVQQLSAIMQEYFAIDDDDQGHAGTDLEDFHDHYALGVDLRKPFAVKDDFKFHIMTVTFILMFMKVVHQYFNTHSHATLEKIRKLRQRINDLGHMIPLANLLTQKITERDQFQAAAQAAPIFSSAQVYNQKQFEKLSNEVDEIKIGLANFPLPNEPIRDAAGNVTSTVAQQITAILVQTQTDLAQAHLDWVVESEFEDPHNPDQPPFLKQVQIMSRWKDYLISTFQKDANSTDLQNTKTSKITILEPVLLGPCRPSEYTDIGCWSANSCIFPFVERFTFGMDFKKNAHYFDIDEYDDRLDRRYDALRFESRYPRLIPISVKSKLHVTFVEEPVSLPTSIPYIDTVTYKIGETTVAKNATQTLQFRDMSLRREPKMILFYTKMADRRELLNDPTIYTDKAASVTGVTLRTDLNPRIYRIRDRTTVDMITMRNYDCYYPQIGITGNCLALPFHELPQRKIVSVGYNNLHGDITVSQNWRNQSLDVEVYATFIYGDTYFDIDNNYQTKQLELDDV